MSNLGNAMELHANIYSRYFLYNLSCIFTAISSITTRISTSVSSFTVYPCRFRVPQEGTTLNNSRFETRTNSFRLLSQVRYELPTNPYLPYIIVIDIFKSLIFPEK
ncbi:hypothetical protein HZS_2762 [Henneguya salminicola]|nr:hypothetical protein HZS_2762 [Henneguya salminicola]